MQLDLVRVGQSNRGTFGVLRYGEIPFALTLERPWAENAPEVSCIPAGHYLCQRVQSPKFGVTFQVNNVPNRTGILFHKGNTLEDTHGCLLVGEEFSGTFDHPMIVSSERGFAEFMDLTAGRLVFDLIIYDAPTPPTRAPL